MSRMTQAIEIEFKIQFIRLELNILLFYTKISRLWFIVQGWRERERQKESERESNNKVNIDGTAFICNLY